METARPVSKWGRSGFVSDSGFAGFDGSGHISTGGFPILTGSFVISASPFASGEVPAAFPPVPASAGTTISVPLDSPVNTVTHLVPEAPRKVDMVLSKR